MLFECVQKCCGLSWRKLVGPMLNWKPPAELGNSVKFSTWDHSTLPPKHSHPVGLHMALEVFVNVCKISKMSSPIEN